MEKRKKLNLMDVEPMPVPTIHETSPYLVKDKDLKEEMADGEEHEEEAPEEANQKAD